MADNGVPTPWDYFKGGAQDWYASGIGRLLDNTGPGVDPMANRKALFAREPASFDARFAPAMISPLGSMASVPMPRPRPEAQPFGSLSPVPMPQPDPRGSTFNQRIPGSPVEEMAPFGRGEIPSALLLRMLGYGPRPDMNAIHPDGVMQDSDPVSQSYRQRNI